MNRLSLREVGEVARLAADGGYAVSGGGPTVHKLADAMGMAPTDVEELLVQARQGGSPVRTFKIVAIVAGILVAFMLGMGIKGATSRPQESLVSPAPVATAPASPAPLSTPNAVADSAPSVSPSPGMTNSSASNMWAPAGDLYTKNSESERRRMGERIRNVTENDFVNGGSGRPSNGIDVSGR